MRIFAAVLLLALGPNVQAYTSPELGYTLPECPKGSLIKIYGPFSMNFMSERSMPFLDVKRRIKDARPCFESSGVTFPKDGFALFYSVSRILVIATTPEEHQMIDSMFDPN